MSTRRQLLVAMALALTVGIAIAAVVRSRDVSPVEPSNGAEAIRMLAAATDDAPFRTLDGRLSGGFTYKPSRPPRESRQKTLRIRIALGAIERAMQEDDRPSLRRARGVARLLLGDPDAAIDDLQRALLSQTGIEDPAAAVRQSIDARLLNDLSVALHARGSAADVLLSVEAADRARMLWPAPESRWNYALAVTSIRLREPAASAWRDYRRTADAAEWHAEAERRVGDLSGRSREVSWEQARTGLEIALATGDLARAHAAAAFPQEMREWLEQTAFSVWANARLRREAAATRTLETIARLAETLASRGDRLLQEHAAALIDRSRGSSEALDAAARAHLAYSRSRSLYQQSEFGLAMREAKSSAEAFDSLSLPFRHVASLTVASCGYIGRDYTTAAGLATSVLEVASTRQYLSAGARARWILALIAMETGDPRVAIEQYGEAVASFGTLHENGNRAAATALLAQSQDAVGLSDESWRRRYEAFAVHDEVQTVRWRHGILIEGAMAAVRRGDLSVARLLLDRAIAIDLEARDDLGVAAALRVRSMLHHLLGEGTAAARDVAAARRFAGRLRDAATRSSFLARIETTAALQTLQRDPERALQILAPASPRQGTLADVAETSLGLSAAHSANPRLALAPLVAAIDALEARLVVDDRTVWHSPLVAQPLLSLYDEAILLLANEGRARDALILGERARVSVRRLNGYSGDFAARDVRHPAAGTAAVVFYVAGQDVISWSTSRAGIRMVVHRGATAEMRTWVKAVVAAPDHAGAAAAKRLSETFLAPHWTNLSGIERLVLVPDDALWSVPFAALPGPSGRYLAEDLVLQLAASLGDATCAPPPPARTRRALLVAAGSAGGSGLPPLPHTRAEVAQARRALLAAGVEAVVASPDRPLDAQALDVDVFHFAGHAVTNFGDPGLSYLVVSDDTRLYARDLRKWKLRGRPVAVLSACEGAVRPGKHLDAWGSIADAFLFAGASGVIAATTPVGDREARAFASAFYAQLASHDPATALHHVQKTAAARRMPPREWASYVHLTGSCTENRRQQ